MKRTIRRKHDTLRCTGLVLMLTAGAAFATESVPEPGPDSLTLDELRTFTDVFNLVRRNYVDPIPERDLLDSALRGMVASLDAHSTYLGPEAFQDHDDTSHGRYGGIGVQLRVDEARLVVDQVHPNGPAWMAGVRQGDWVLAVGGEPVRGRPLNQSMDALLGEPDSQVTVRFRTAKLPPRDLVLTRQYIPLPSVQGALLDGDLAYLQINQFHLETAAEFENMLDELRAQAPTGLRGIALDLRDNRGGVIRSAAEIADGFIESGLVVYTRGRYPASHLEYHAEPGDWAPGVPLAVLVNRGSASASEILAGALQDHGRATIVGDRTYGKGTVQSILRLRNGSALKLTTARYFTPAGRSIDKDGITPDERVDDRSTTEGAGNVAVPDVRFGAGFRELDAADATLGRAVRVLRGRTTRVAPDAG